jgi:hypothetical protein
MGPGQKPLSLVTVCNVPSTTAKEILRNSRPTTHARCEMPGIINGGALEVSPTEVSSTEISAAPIPAAPVAGIEG